MPTLSPKSLAPLTAFNRASNKLYDAIVDAAFHPDAVKLEELLKLWHSEKIQTALGPTSSPVHSWKNNKRGPLYACNLFEAVFMSGHDNLDVLRVLVENGAKKDAYTVLEKYAETHNQGNFVRSGLYEHLKGFLEKTGDDKEQQKPGISEFTSLTSNEYQEATLLIRQTLGL